MSSINISAINPYIRLVYKSSILRAHSLIKRRIIFDYELLYAESGTMLLVYDDVEYRCEPGSFVLIRPGVSHSFHMQEEDFSQPHIHFDITYTPKSTQIPISFKDFDQLSPTEHAMVREDLFDGYPYYPFVNFSDKQKALELFYDIMSGPKGGPRGNATLLQKARLMELLYLLIQDNYPDCLAEMPAPTQYDISTQLKAYIDAGQGLSSSLGDLEKQYSYSKYYLERRFKETYGISLIAYRNDKRMQVAKKLLEFKSVSSVAEELGFGSVCAFSRAFKKHHGYSPSDIRKGV